MNGSGLAKLLCVFLINSLLLIANPFNSAGKSCVKSLKFLSYSPISTSGQFNNIERIACVAHALLIT